MRPMLFEIPLVGWPVSGYQLMLTVGFVLAILLAFRLGRRDRLNENHLLDLALWAVVAGIFGSRIFYYYEFYELHFAHRPWYHIFYVHEGGYVFYGGFLCAAAGAIAYMLFRSWRGRATGGPAVRVMATLDVCAAPVALGLSFGRIGCLLNGCCWGKLDGTIDAEGVFHQGSAFLSLRFPQGSYPWLSHHRDHGWIPADALECLPIHATQVYSWAGALLICAALLVLLRYRRREGQVSGAFFLLYGPFRFVIEALREHSQAHEMARFPVVGDIVQWGSASTSLLSPDGIITYSQLVSLILVFVGIAWFTLASLFGPPYRRATAE